MLSRPWPSMFRTGSTLVLSGRVPPPFSLAQVRGSGRLLEIGPAVLALSHREAEALLEASGVDLSHEQVATLVRRTAGWAAGLYLAALAIRDAGAHDAAAFGGDDRYLADFFRSECLFALEPERLAFLRRTSVLERVSGPLCDAVLDSTGSARELEAIEEASLFLVPLDRSRSWFRYHDLFRDALRSELERGEPELVPLLHQRAADWFEAHEDWDAAIGHAADGQDLDRAATIFGAHGFAEYDAGPTPGVERCLDLFDVEELARHSELGLAGTWWHALRGRTVEAERWLTMADSVAEPKASDAPSSALLRAAVCREGVEQMRSDAEAAVSGLGAADRRRPLALLLLGASQALLGDGETADVTLRRAVDESSVHRSLASGAAALAFRALVGWGRSDEEGADSLALRARALVGADPTLETGLGALVAVVAGRALLRRGRWDEAHQEIAAAERLAPTLTDSLPWLSAQAHLELARAHLTLRDLKRARAHVVEADTILERRPALGIIVDDADRLRHEVDGHQAPLVRETRLQRRAPAGAAARNTSLVPGDRLPALHLPQHRQDRGALHLSQARCRAPERRGRPSSRARTSRKPDRPALGRPHDRGIPASPRLSAGRRGSTPERRRPVDGRQAFSARRHSDPRMRRRRRSRVPARAWARPRRLSLRPQRR